MSHSILFGELGHKGSGVSLLAVRWDWKGDYVKFLADVVWNT